MGVKDKDCRLKKVEYLERVFACSFKNGRTYFLRRKDIPEDDGSKIKKYAIENDAYYFTVQLKSGREYIVPWDFILHMCEEKYEFHKSKAVESISSAEIGKRIKGLRNKKGIRQSDLAKKTGILRANIARIESGRHNPSLETLERISGAMGIPVADLLSKRDYEGWLETLDIMSDQKAMEDIKQAEKDIKKGRVYDFEEVFGKRIKQAKKKRKQR
jgi:transcriptional regulator with XRE-family HTH domain